MGSVRFFVCEVSTISRVYLAHKGAGEALRSSSLSCAFMFFSARPFVLKDKQGLTGTNKYNMTIRDDRGSIQLSRDPLKPQNAELIQGFGLSGF